MPLVRDDVRLRRSGLVALTDETLVRFGTVEPHQVIKAALAAADLYGPVLAAMRLPPQAILAVSCFVLTEGWIPRRLAAGTRYASYYTIEAAAVRRLGYELWPTDTFTDGMPDPNNPVHVDIVIVRDLDPADIAVTDRHPGATASTPGPVPPSLSAADRWSPGTSTAVRRT